MIDETRLKELKDDFGEEDFGDLIEAFLEETWEALDALEGLHAAGDANPLGDQFHLLKGCARNIGASRFADQCEIFEHDPGAFNAGDYQSLRGEFQAVCDWFSGEAERKTA